MRLALAGLLREMRPQQWYKQGVVLLGVVFSRHLLDPAAWVGALAAATAFTAVAGAVYVFNDISDVEEDRQHPTKRNRPIASGQVSIPLAVAFGTLLAVGGLALAYATDVLVLGVILAYVGQNALYTLFLKEVAFADTIVIAVGFVLRAIAGVVAISVRLSPWLIVCTFLLALVLALGKRRHELDETGGPKGTDENDGENTRESLGTYRAGAVDQLLVVAAATLLMAYALYTFTGTDDAMMLTLPFAFFGVFRYHHLVHTTDVGGKPEYLLLDRPLASNCALWLAVVVAVLYDLPAVVGFPGVMP